MPRFEAQIWLPNEHPYQVETSAANIFAAKEIIARREGVDEKYVNRVFLINESQSESSSQNESGGSTDSSGLLGLILIICGGMILINFWPIILGLSILGLIVWIIKVMND